jgi:hypothetical protein
MRYPLLEYYYMQLEFIAVRVAIRVAVVRGYAREAIARVYWSCIR